MILCSVPARSSLVSKSLRLGLVSLFFGLVACTESTGPGETPLGSSSSSDPIVIGSSSSPVVGPTTFGAIASAPDANAVMARYAEWKAIYVVNVEQEFLTTSTDITYLWPVTAGSARIRFDDKTETVSEAIGYGMLIAMNAGDWDLFNRLWVYHQTYAKETSWLMDWKIDRFDYMYPGQGSAADADLDVATALLIAFEKTGVVEYKNYALLVAKSIWDLEVAQDGSYLLYPGNSGWKTKATFNPSYFSPVGFKLFAKYDLERNWTAMLDANYNWMTLMNTTGAGLFPDWAGADAMPKNPDAPSTSTTRARTYNTYALESIRIPWRLVWDWHWNGDTRALTILSRMYGFVTTDAKSDFNQVKSQYNHITGIAAGGMAPPLGYKSSFCALGMINNDTRTAWLNQCAPVLNAQAITGYSYFHHILHMLYLQMWNGMFVEP